MKFNRAGLPGWTYHNEELFELEASNIFKKLAIGMSSK